MYLAVHWRDNMAWKEYKPMYEHVTYTHKMGTVPDKLQADDSKERVRHTNLLSHPSPSLPEY